MEAAYAGNTRKYILFILAFFMANLNAIEQGNSIAENFIVQERLNNDEIKK